MLSECSSERRAHFCFASLEESTVSPSAVCRLTSGSRGRSYAKTIRGVCREQSLRVLRCSSFVCCSDVLQVLRRWSVGSVGMRQMLQEMQNNVKRALPLRHASHVSARDVGSHKAASCEGKRGKRPPFPLPRPGWQHVTREPCCALLFPTMPCRREEPFPANPGSVTPASALVSAIPPSLYSAAQLYSGWLLATRWLVSVLNTSRFYPH